MYANNLKIFMKIKSNNDSTNFQQDFDHFTTEQSKISSFPKFINVKSNVRCASVDSYQLQSTRYKISPFPESIQYANSGSHSIQIKNLTFTSGNIVAKMFLMFHKENLETLHGILHHQKTLRFQRLITYKVCLAGLVPLSRSIFEKD